MKPAGALLLAIVVFAASSQAHPKNIQAVELSRLVEAFMTRPDDKAEWSMGADESTPQVTWSSTGIEKRPNCGGYESCRRGSARISINGNEIKHLRQRLEPVTWEVFMTSRSIEKFSPERVEISPFCDTVACAFDFAAAMTGNGFSLTKVCEAGPESFRQIGYLVKKKDKQTHVVVNENLGSGGPSNFLTIHLEEPLEKKELCAEARAEED